MASLDQEAEIVGPGCFLQNPRIKISFIQTRFKRADRYLIKDDRLFQHFGMP